MITSKNNDIGNLIHQFRQRDTPPKERKVLLTQIEDELKSFETLEKLPVKWTYVLDNTCWPAMTRNERSDLKNAAGRVLRLVGALLIGSDVYPEFLIWMGTLYETVQRKMDETRADIVFSVHNIVDSYRKTEIPTEIDVENAEKSLKWMISVLPTASNSVFKQCLKGIVIVAKKYPKAEKEHFEEAMRTIASNLPDLNTHEKNFEVLTDSLNRFSSKFAENADFAEEIVRMIRPDIKKNGLGRPRELNRRMQLTMTVVKMTKSRRMLDETNALISEIFVKCEENDGKWTSASLITVVCDVFNELLILGKNDEITRKSVEESMCEVLRELNLSKQNTMEKQAFFNSLAKIVSQLPVESPIKTRVHQIVFNRQTGLFTPENRDIRMFGNNRIYKDLANLISVLLTPTSLNHLQATYTDLRKIMIDSIARLKLCSPSSDSMRWHESVLLLFFSALQNISCAKSSLIVMMGIRPSIFEFFTQELPLTEYWLAANHPQVYHLFVTILFQHLKSHDFYISQSDYLIRADNTIGTIGQTKRDYAKKQVIALHKIISNFGNRLLKKTRLTISTWLHCLIVSAYDQKVPSERFRTLEWFRLRSIVAHQSVLNWNNETVNEAFSLLASMGNWPEIGADIERDIVEKTRKAKWREATLIWEAGDSKRYIRQSISPVYQMSQERQQKFIGATSFGAEEFTIVTNFLLKQIVPTTFRKGSYVWMDEVLEAMTSSCRSTAEKTDPTLPDAFIEKWDWVINQTANFCIINKMKTPLGKPQQTFAALAAEVNNLAKEVMTRKPKSSKKEEENGSVAPAELKYSVQWLRVHLLLKLIEVLEKLMISAIHGGSGVFNLVEIPVSSRQFFVTNSASCEVWLNRVYYPALIVAYFNGYYALVIRFGSNALSHYVRQKDSEEKSTTYGVSTASLMSLSMAVLGEPMEIIGLRRRVREEFGTESGQSLMEALVEMAHARYENALIALENVLATEASLNETLRIVIQTAIVDMLNRIRLPQAVDYYKNTLFGEDADAVTEQFKSIEMLTKFEKPTTESKEKRQIVEWSVKDRLAAVESAYAQPMRRTELFEHQKELSAMGALTLSTDVSCKLYADVSSTSLIIANLIDKMPGAVQTRNRMTDADLFERNENGNLGDKLAICRKVMHWSRHIKHFRGQSSVAHGEIVRLSRKTSNCELAHFHINSAIRGEKLSAWMRLEIDRQRMKLVKSQHLDVRIREMNCLFGGLADVFQTTCQLKANFEQLPPGPLRENMLREGYYEEMGRREEHIGRASIQLAEFFQTLPDTNNILAPDLVPTLIWSEVHRRSDEFGCGDQMGIIGSLFAFASEMCPILAKAHLRMAQWAFEMAKTENAPSAPLFPIYQFGADQKEDDELWKCLETTGFTQLEKQVRKAVSDTNRASAILSNGEFRNVWESARLHRIKFLSIAVSAYFQFIRSMSSGPDFLPFSKKEETTLATLRILELLVKHGDVLIDVINEGLSITNVHVWKEILPQLFARLSHPSEHIRKTLVDLISRICTAAPHAVVFQVVSGAASSSDDEEEEVEEDQLNDDRNRVRACCEQLESKMAQSYPSLVRDVRQFVAELERINLLNEEKWTVVLGTMEHEMEKRLALIQAENAKTAMAEHLEPHVKDEITEKKTELLTRQIFDVLDELYQQTVAEPSKSNNEREFVRTFGDDLINAYAESKRNRFISPEKSWAPFRNLIGAFVHRNQKKGLQTFETADISPYLASLENSCVPMPGQESVEFDKVVSISKVARQVTILPTKTRPKKLGFVGSDGKQCAFLFKGREDLHLDERVMQFLRLCNVMLHPGKAKSRQLAEYQAHHYAVIPLGPRSGLIKWVEGATPMFHIYRKWQIKEKAVRQALKKNGELIAEIERPSEMYHNMIKEKFAEHNIDLATASDRTKWPLAVMKEVFEGLAAKTPRDLISRELWMKANDAATWWAVTKRFARSLAVMSMVGSVLGLGDRHLDNLLVDLKYGHVVHIDYNICFDKGRNLRIPETVPFRLTRNMLHALGPSEQFGTFRESCVHVLSCLRSGRPVLTMLLDAFVFDPLVDWTNHEHSTASGVSLALQLAVYGSNWKTKSSEKLGETVELLHIRMTEIHTLWMNNRDDLFRWLSQVIDCLLIEKSLLGANGMYAQQRVKAGTELREAVTRHQALAKEIRPLLRVIGKENEEFSNYLKFYKQAFINPLLKGHSALRHEVDIDTCVLNFNIVMQNIDYVFRSLVSLASLPIESITSARTQQFQPPPGLENVWVVKQDQQENSEAREVVRRVERRLNGWLDEDSERKLSPREEADLLISEATNPSNLCTMYEGWTAWV
ncbi:unnamed protein product [Caenorhabditis sp. 36 PRJEB53466]|nr:unnamed protein product [Caenorhabditis sp. 36 PRJEB53466]